MNTRLTLSRSRLLCRAALAAASLSASGCAVEPDPAPEPIAEAEAPLVVHRHVSLGLIQVHDSQGALAGYGYTRSAGTGQSLQRWLLFSNQKGNDLTFRPHDPDDDPAAIAGLVVEDLAGWEQLVGALWFEASLGTGKIYAMCHSQVYEQGGAYDGESWRMLPSSPPLPRFPSWEPVAGRWKGFTPLNVTPQPTPLIWPPTDGWLQANAPPLAIQLDPGDGKVFQWKDNLYLERGFFFSEYGVMDDVNTEYFFMNESYAPAGGPGTDTWNLGNDISQWGTIELFWGEAEARWAPDTAIAINGCVNYHRPELPTPL